MRLKWSIFFLLIIHSIFSLMVASYDIYPKLELYSAKYVNSFFRQGWAFFGPYPIVNYIQVEFKCIFDNKVSDWKNLTRELEKSKAPLSSFIRTNDSEYIVDTHAERIVYSIPSEEYKLCEIGGCTDLFKKISQNQSYVKLNKISSDICSIKSADHLVGTELKIVIENFKYFSERLNKNIPRVFTDELTLPAKEI